MKWYKLAAAFAETQYSFQRFKHKENLYFFIIAMVEWNYCKNDSSIRLIYACQLGFLKFDFGSFQI